MHEQMAQGRMIRHRTIVSIFALAACAAAAAPVSARANPLLSGYGGPGEGSQVLIGSALLNGPSGGGGGAGGSTSSQTAGSPGGAGGAGSSATGIRGTISKGARGAANGRPGAGVRPSRGPGAGAGGSTSGGAAQAYGATSTREASRGGGTESQTLGLAGDDLLYLLLALAVLVITGLLTRRLTHATATETGERLKQQKPGPD